MTGGIATGKSTIAKAFAELGAKILDADKTAREVVQPGTPCWLKLKTFLGPGYFCENGQLLRQKLRAAIIQDPRLRQEVEGILHPCIFELMDSEWERTTKERPDQTVIFDIPLLFEANSAARFDIVILVYAPPEIQVKRLMSRDRLSQAEAEATLTMQLPIESKKAMSHIVIDNSYDLEYTQIQVERTWKGLTTKA